MHNIKCTILNIFKCMVQCCKIYFHCCATNSGTFSSGKTETLYLLNNNFSNTSSLAPDYRLTFCFHKLDYSR